MVVHAFPIAKLGALLMKQISKPIANVVKHQAKSSPIFRKYVCHPPARFYNWCEVKAKMWLLQMGQPVNITILNEEASINLGAELLGEGIIFLIAAGILIAEYNRSSKKEAAKEEAKKREMAELQAALRDLFIQSEEQAAHVRELTRKLGELETSSSHRRPYAYSDESRQDPPPGDPPVFLPKVDKSTDISEDGDPAVSSETAHVEVVHFNPRKGVIFQAINNLENEFRFETDHKREPGVLTTALKHLYEDVYRIPLKF